MVIQESVRYVNVAATFRRCTKPWKIPDTDIIIPVGTDIVIPIMSLHRDPEYWEDPDRFDPERFAPENKANIRKGAYQPFGQGPRQCLGYNYVRYVIKLTMAYVLRNFNIENSENLPKQFGYNPETFVPTPKPALKIKFVRRSQNLYNAQKNGFSYLMTKSNHDHKYIFKMSNLIPNDSFLILIRNEENERKP